MENIYYVISSRKVNFKNIGAFYIRYFEIVLHVDMYLHCKYFSDISEEKYIGYVECSVNECEGTTTERRLEKFVQEAIRQYGKNVLYGNYNAVEVKNERPAVV